MKIVTIVGARPQFIKAAVVSRAFKAERNRQINEVIVHTGQHYDANMSEVFFEQMDIPVPEYNLGISGVNHGAMTGQMMIKLESVLIEEKPDWLLIYGDTNSTLAGALVASKLQIPVAHVEAGLRSYNMKMPEEVNRIVADSVSDMLFCPTDTALSNIKKENHRGAAYNVGDVMYDAALYYSGKSDRTSKILSELSVHKEGYVLATCHRAENTDDKANLVEILAALNEISRETPVLIPMHPRTRIAIDEYNLSEYLATLTVLEPLNFFDMVSVEKNAKAILTDSGGVQKEAFFYGVPCITMRDETEWVETVRIGANVLTGANRSRILNSFADIKKIETTLLPYGNGKASEKILSHLI